MNGPHDSAPSENATSRVAELRRAAVAKRRLRENMDRIASGDVGREIGMSMAATSAARIAVRKTRHVVRETPLIAIGTAIAAGFLMGSRRRRHPPASMHKGWAPKPAPAATSGQSSAFSVPNPIWTGLASLGVQLFLDALASRRFDTMDHGG